MMDPKSIDFSKYDRPEILQVLFHPRPELPGIFGGGGGSGLDVMIPVATDIAIGGRFHLHAKDDPTILFFHGNGEIVADYDDMGPIYNRLGVNFFPVDYRGYGRSGGQPSITSMMQDCHKILHYVSAWLPENGYNGPLLLMGRSLGSASGTGTGCYLSGESSRIDHRKRICAGRSSVAAIRDKSRLPGIHRGVQF